MGSLREDYAENTRHVLLGVALPLFVERGYAHVAAEEIVRAAGVTRGALYHHFDGKRGLFEAVFVDLEDRAAQRISAEVTGGTDARDRADRGIAAFLDICTEDAYRQLVLVQGPVALGWPRWRELDELYLGGLVRTAVAELIEAGLISDHPLDVIARGFYGMLTELSFVVADAPDRDAARRQALQLADAVLDGLRPAAG